MDGWFRPGLARTRSRQRCGRAAPFAAAAQTHVLMYVHSRQHSPAVNLRLILRSLPRLTAVPTVTVLLAYATTCGLIQLQVPTPAGRRYTRYLTTFVFIRLAVHTTTVTAFTTLLWCPRTVADGIYPLLLDVTWSAFLTCCWVGPLFYYVGYSGVVADCRLRSLFLWVLRAPARKKKEVDVGEPCAR